MGREERRLTMMTRKKKSARAMCFWEKTSTSFCFVASLSIYLFSHARARPLVGRGL